LTNRRELEEKVHVYLQTVLLPEDLIKALSFGEIENPDYIKNVEILNKKLQKLKASEIYDSKSLQEVKPEMEKL
jgi:hypothetical protein